MLPDGWALSFPPPFTQCVQKHLIRLGAGLHQNYITFHSQKSLHNTPMEHSGDVCYMEPWRTLGLMQYDGFMSPTNIDTYPSLCPPVRSSWVIRGKGYCLKFQVCRYLEAPVLCWLFSIFYKIYTWLLSSGYVLILFPALGIGSRGFPKLLLPYTDSFWPTFFIWRSSCCTGFCVWRGRQGTEFPSFRQWSLMAYLSGQSCQLLSFFNKNI